MRKFIFSRKSFRATIATAGLTGLLCLTGCASLIATFNGPGRIDEARDTRTLGTVVEDENIEVKVKANLYNNDPAFKDLHFTVASYNKAVLLVGQVPNQRLFDFASKMSQVVREVRTVHNELTIGPQSTLSERLNDSWISTKIRAHFLATKGFPASKTKVITESGVVYLMGLLSAEKTDWAVNIIRNVYGVKKIVKIVEYMPETANQDNRI